MTKMCLYFIALSKNLQNRPEDQESIILPIHLSIVSLSMFSMSVAALSQCTVCTGEGGKVWKACETGKEKASRTGRGESEGGERKRGKNRGKGKEK